MAHFTAVWVEHTHYTDTDTHTETYYKHRHTHTHYTHYTHRDRQRDKTQTQISKAGKTNKPLETLEWGGSQISHNGVTQRYIKWTYRPHADTDQEINLHVKERDSGAD